MQSESQNITKNLEESIQKEKKRFILGAIVVIVLVIIVMGHLTAREYIIERASGSPPRLVAVPANAKKMAEYAVEREQKKKELIMERAVLTEKLNRTRLAIRILKLDLRQKTNMISATQLWTRKRRQQEIAAMSTNMNELVDELAVIKGRLVQIENELKLL